MAADPSTIPASATVTNLLAEPLALAGLKTLAPGEVRVITLSAFLLAQRSMVWNGLYNAAIKGLISTSDVTFDVNEIATGHQGVLNRGGQGTGFDIVEVPGGLGLPASVTFTNLLDEPLVIAGIYLENAADPQPGYLAPTIHDQASSLYGATIELFRLASDTWVLGLAELEINQQATLWNALITARDAGYITSADLTTAVADGYTGHQGHENRGGHGNGGNIKRLVATH